LLRPQRTCDLRPCSFLAAVEDCGKRIPPRDENLKNLRAQKGTGNLYWY
jgi:hypothetical protein